MASFPHAPPCPGTAKQTADLIGENLTVFPLAPSPAQTSRRPDPGSSAVLGALVTPGVGQSDDLSDLAKGTTPFPPNFSNLGKPRPRELQDNALKLDLPFTFPQTLFCGNIPTGHGNFSVDSDPWLRPSPVCRCGRSPEMS